MVRYWNYDGSNPSLSLGVSKDIDTDELVVSWEAVGFAPDTSGQLKRISCFGVIENDPPGWWEGYRQP